MDSLIHLKSLFSWSQDLGAKDLTPCGEIDQVLRQLEARTKGAGSLELPLDLQEKAVLHFWESMRLDSLRDGRLVSFGMCLPIVPGGLCILEDRPRFSALLNGVDQWVKEPRRYRRCYQGLVANYFGYDANNPKAPASGKENWMTLGGYLGDRSTCITGSYTNPDWVTCIVENTQLFGEAPCEPYAADMLRGETQAVTWLRNCLGIDDSSWFVRELVLAQVAAATKETDHSFVAMLPRVLKLLAPNLVLRDRGLILLLDRYARISSRQLQQELRDRAVEWWGNPWLTSNSMRWGGVSAEARAMVAEWLKLEFIEAFFTLLAEEGAGDRRRLEFWKRYVHAIDDIHFALGADARRSRTRDFVELLSKMKGRTVPLIDTVSSNNAFVMTIGDLVVVEFSGRANALYGYDRRQGLPFDLETPVGTVNYGRNSLKNSRRVLWLTHGDGIRGWNKWEQRFEAHLREQFHIDPTTRTWISPPSKPYMVPPNPKVAPVSQPGVDSGPTWTSIPYSRNGLRKLAADERFEVEDNTARGGNLWVRAAVSPNAGRVLSGWGFKFKVGKGWWKGE